MEPIILEVKNLRIYYETQESTVRALNGVDLVIRAGTSHGLVGETGAGKTTLAKGIMGLTPKPYGKIISGQVLYENQDLLLANKSFIREIRGGHISMIFQDPMTSLNPVMTVGDQIMEAIRNHSSLSRPEAEKKTGEILELVGIPGARAEEYPHQFSGGMKQRVVIAIALACNPKVLIADEPTTALDVTIQAQILETIRDLREKLHVSMLLITHDLGVIAQNCEYVSVIYAGEIVETGTVHDIFGKRLHPYTQGLFSSIPNINKDVERLIPINGLMPDPTDLPKGCAFCERCQYAGKRCAQEHPPLLNAGGEEGIHQVRCFRMESGKKGGV
jgi:peptide/nickel transport system ATP-binding protein